jgi:hypothetical protein
LRSQVTVMLAATGTATLVAGWVPAGATTLPAGTPTPTSPSSSASPSSASPSTASPSTGTPSSASSTTASTTTSTTAAGGTTLTATGTTTTTSTTAAGGGPASLAHPARPEAGPNPDAYYGNPKVGVEVATSTPGLYPVFGPDDAPDLTGFVGTATPADPADDLAGVSEPQPTCDPSTSLATVSAPNLYCEPDTDNGNEFPMSNASEQFDLAMTPAPGWALDPDQTTPISQTVEECPGGSQGSDNCQIESNFEPPPPSDVTFFKVIGIYRPLEVTVKTASGTLLDNVDVSLTCTAPAGAPSYACPPAGEASSAETTTTTSTTLGTAGRLRPAGGPASTSSTTTSTGSSGTGRFSGIYLPGSTIGLQVTDAPAGYQPGSLTATVPSPVSSATTSGALLSAAAQTPVDLVVVLDPTPPPTTTTTTTSTTSTTLAPTTTTTAALAATTPASSLPFTGSDAESVAEDAGLIMLAGAGLVVAGRRRSRRGTHFRRRR